MIISRLILYVVVVIMTAISCSCHNRNNQLQYPRNWPIPRLTAPIGSVPARLLNPIGDNPYIVDGMVANNGSCVLYDVGFKNSIGWTAIVEDFEKKMIELHYHRDRNCTEKSIQYVSEDTKTIVILYGTIKDDTVATISIAVYK